MAKASIKVETIEKLVKEDVTTYNFSMNYRELDVLVTVLRDSTFTDPTNIKILRALREAADSIYK